MEKINKEVKELNRDIKMIQLQLKCMDAKTDDLEMLIAAAGIELLRRKGRKND